MAQTPEATFQRCCRLCAEEQEVTIMIFSKEAEDMLLKNKLNKYLLIEVEEEDKLPKNICIQCCTKLQSACEFIDTARKAQEVLHDRILVLEQMGNDALTVIKSEPVSDDESRVTEMEVSVDPMMVLQNSEEPFSPNPSSDHNIQPNYESVTNINGVDGEYVTLKLIKRGSEFTDDSKKDFKPFPCLTCKRSFYTELALKNHSWIHINEDKTTDKRYRCAQCAFSFDYKADLMSHIKDHKNNGMCQLCGRFFRTQANLNAHMALHKTSGKSFTCKVCGRSYNTRSNLNTHSVTHSNERPFKCNLCKKSFKRNQDLKFHINQHTGAKPYKCPFCEKSFASSGNCYSHKSRMHPGRRVDSGKRRRGPKPKPVPIETGTTLNKGVHRYQCQICNHSFMRRDNFTYHMYQHTGQKPFECSLCSEKFVTRKGLLLHHDKEHPGHDRPLALLSKNALLK